MPADNAVAFARMQGAIDLLAKLGTLPEDVAAAAVEPFKQEMLANIAAQRTPNGKAWQPGAKGQPVLVNAGKALKVTSRGPVLTATLTGPEARHHLGIAKGHVRRQILPGRGSLGGISKILKRIATARFKAATHG